MFAFMTFLFRLIYQYIHHRLEVDVLHSILVATNFLGIIVAQTKPKLRINEDNHPLNLDRSERQRNDRNAHLHAR